MVMSVAACALVVAGLIRFGVPALHGDEGALAHTWQLLMVCQIPEIAWFALTRLRRAPRPALKVLGIQLALALAAMAPVLLFGL